MALDTFGRIEVMGHQSFVGKLSEEIVCGVALVRVEVQAGGKAFTKLFGAQAIYCITPMTEEEVRELERYAAARLLAPAPPTIAFDEPDGGYSVYDDDEEDEEADNPLDDYGPLLEADEPARSDAPF